MDILPAQDGYEIEFVATLTESYEVVVSYFPGDTCVQRIDKTSAYIMELIQNNNLDKIDGKHTITSGRYTKEHGHHYWVRMWDPNKRS